MKVLEEFYKTREKADYIDVYKAFIITAHDSKLRLNVDMDKYHLDINKAIEFIFETEIRYDNFIKVSKKAQIVIVAIAIPAKKFPKDLEFDIEGTISLSIDDKDVIYHCYDYIFTDLEVKRIDGSEMTRLFKYDIKKIN